MSATTGEGRTAGAAGSQSEPTAEQAAETLRSKRFRFRGGPTLPAIFLGAAAGILASHLPGFALTPAVGLGMGAATAAVLRLPLSPVALATLLTVDAGTGDEPLIIVGVVVAYLTTVALSTRPRRAGAGV